MTLRSALASVDRPLTASEKRVVNVLLVDAESGSKTAASVAERAGTHETTVVRLARKLGYRGYPELRADLRQGNGHGSGRRRTSDAIGHRLGLAVICRRRGTCTPAHP